MGETTSAAAPTTARCGCCGQTRARDRVTQLGDTPGVFICAGCALWAARRVANGGARIRARVLWQQLLSRRGRSGAGATVRSAVPILPSGDLAVSEEFYAGLGFAAAGRYDRYLVTHHGAVEVHLTSTAPAFEPGTAGSGSPPVAGTCFVQVRDAVEYYKKLAERGVRGLGAPQAQEYGLVEFTVVDPFGNRLRFGSPTG